ASVVAANLFVTMEGTVTGTFALSCVCIWNGFFNSIQSVCRERDIVKREHRSGLHIFSYIIANMIYQALLCAAQTVILILLCMAMKVHFPTVSCVTPWPLVDMGITIFLTTYAADMMALMVSCLVRNTTTAMTLMPFLLIFQLVFSGSYFDLSGAAMKLTDFTISKWSLTAMCSLGNYNELPMVSVWNSIYKMKDIIVEGEKPVLEFLRMIEKQGMRDEFLKTTAGYNQNPAYVMSLENVLKCWAVLLVFAVIFAIVGLVSLEYIDKDKR
ncbi:MAG: ABC transporter permease, partial [Lachnospiraceae bacterium]|nr:ABC transporter permease [Lachnospiraceae bacterium]